MIEPDNPKRHKPKMLPVHVVIPVIISFILVLAVIVVTIGYRYKRKVMLDKPSRYSLSLFCRLHCNGAEVS